VVKGFGGMRVKDGLLHFNPFIPDQWKSYSFRIEFRGHVIKVKVSKQGVETMRESGEPVQLVLNGNTITV
jgi:maltose phosphorylase